MWAKGTGEEGKESPKVLPRIQKLMDRKERRAAAPCLICAHRRCSRHRSANFRKEGITLCSNCELFFELDCIVDFIVDCVSNDDPDVWRRDVDHMIDLYDRCMLLLRYSSHFLDDVAGSLERTTRLTVTAVQTGAEARGHFSKPRRLATRIIPLHGMAHSVLRVAGTPRDACCMDHIRTEAYVPGDGKLSAERLKRSIGKNETAIKAGARATMGAALGGTIAAERVALGGVVERGGGDRRHRSPNVRLPRARAIQFPTAGDIPSSDPCSQLCLFALCLCSLRPVRVSPTT